jgi:transketolase
MTTTMGRANLEVFADTLLEMARRDRDILVVTSDSRGSGKLTEFGKTLPAQLIEVGIAEQNLVGMAAGLASAGKKVFAVSPACFLTARALEQIKNDVAYSHNKVTVVGISAGVSYGPLGTTHHSLHDFAALQTIHHLDVVAPADNTETRAVIQAAVTHPRPIYVRFGKKALPLLPDTDGAFAIGKARCLKAGNDITFAAIGETVLVAYEAALLLRTQGIEARVLSLHTLKPLDREAILQAATETRALITVEEHSVHGGLGAACASLLLQAGKWLPFRIVGLEDDETPTGNQGELFAHYGITPAALAQTATELLK